jgi:hypothetical protein
MLPGSVCDFIFGGTWNRKSTETIQTLQIEFPNAFLEITGHLQYVAEFLHRCAQMLEGIMFTKFLVYIYLLKTFADYRWDLWLYLWDDILESYQK